MSGAWGSLPSPRHNPDGQAPPGLATILGHLGLGTLKGVEMPREGGTKRPGKGGVRVQGSSWDEDRKGDTGRGAMRKQGLNRGQGQRGADFNMGSGESPARRTERPRVRRRVQGGGDARLGARLRAGRGRAGTWPTWGQRKMGVRGSDGDRARTGGKGYRKVTWNAWGSGDRGRDSIKLNRAGDCRSRGSPREPPDASWRP